MAMTRCTIERGSLLRQDRLSPARGWRARRRIWTIEDRRLCYFDRPSTGADRPFRRAIREGARCRFRGRAVERLTFIVNNLPAIGQLTVQHVSFVVVTVSLARLTGVTSVI